MQTKLLTASQAEAISEAAGLLKSGHLVAFPTDTLYGLGADPFDPAALALLYEAKGRSLGKGIPILLSDPGQLDKVAAQTPAFARSLIERYWPGPLTLILPRHSSLPAIISPNEGIAVRIPDHPLALRFIEAAGGAVAASSANRSGQPPATSAEEALAAMHGLAAAVLDGGPVLYGRASTILDCTVWPPQVRREGPIPETDLIPAAAVKR